MTTARLRLILDMALMVAALAGAFLLPFSILANGLTVSVGYLVLGAVRDRILGKRMTPAERVADLRQRVDADL